jgi:hypothetical protein
LAGRRGFLDSNHESFEGKIFNSSYVSLCLDDRCKRANLRFDR